ncbi:MAG: hypothetical protein PWR32_302, partial [Candidatus Woesearchaeota archaeon]|nr:hypothetical protein [Candidatus Woesearchaeota archaeon]
MLIKSFKALRNSYLLVLALILIVIPFVFSATLYVEIHEPVFDGTVASASTTIVNDPEANCPGTPGTTVSTSCTDFTYGSSCCVSEGNYIAYAYSDEGESAGNSGIFVEYTVNWDNSETYCTCKVGSGHWNLGGEVAASSCCGDDSGEYVRNCVDSTDQGSCGADTTACCNSNTDCVDNYGLCESSGACYGTPIMGNSYCNSGTWENPDESSSYCVSSCDLTSGDQGIGWNLGGEIAATNCCGDDPSEYYRVCSDSSANGACGSDTTACCNS